MYLFFAHLSFFALWTLIIIALISIVIKNFWCRYLCPYGALLGFLSFLSPLKITRRAATCIDCELCTKACPSSINVHKAKKVLSDECMSCYACVEICPVKDTLVMSAGSKGKSIPSQIFGFLLLGIFLVVTGLAMLTGHWHNSISKDEYLKRIQNIESPLYQHNRGQVSTYGPTINEKSEVLPKEFFDELAEDYDGMTGFEHRFPYERRFSDACRAVSFKKCA